VSVLKKSILDTVEIVMVDKKLALPNEEGKSLLKGGYSKKLNFFSTYNK